MHAHANKLTLALFFLGGSKKFGYGARPTTGGMMAECACDISWPLEKNLVSQIYLQ
jgi:hypothetical protein